MENLTFIKQNLIETVKEASFIMKNESFKIHEKNGASNIVTTSDLNVQHFLCEKLKELLPSSSFFCEEEDLKDSTSDYVWIIDPIDGTANYSRGIAECCISVALAHKGTVVLGVVYIPDQDYMFSAELGGGAALNGKPISSSDKRFDESLFCTAMSLYRKEFAPLCMNIISDVYNKCNDFRRFGSCAVELCYLAAGKCDLYFELRLFPWDYAASYLILSEAGGVATSLDGEPPSLVKPSPLIAANNKENHRLLLDMVRLHMKEIPYEW